jgi:cell division protein FtsX
MIKKQFHDRRQLIEEQRTKKQEQLKVREQRRLKEVQDKEKWVDKLQAYVTAFGNQKRK